MKPFEYRVGFTILPDTKKSRNPNIYRFPIEGSFARNMKQAEILLRNDLFPPKPAEISPKFKIGCAACLLAHEPNGFVGIASKQKSVVEYVRDKAQLEAAMEASSWHHDHAAFCCVVPATSISAMVQARTRSQISEAQKPLMACLDLQCGDTNLNGSRIIIGHHLQTMQQLVGSDDADYWFAMVQQKGADKVLLDLPGGKRHLGETSLECAIRETREETSLQVGSDWIQAILTHEKEPGNNYYRMQPPAELLDATEGVTQSISTLKLESDDLETNDVTESTAEEKFEGGSSALTTT